MVVRVVTQAGKEVAPPRAALLVALQGPSLPVGIVQAGDGARVDAGPRVERDAEIREDPGEQARDPRRSASGGLRQRQRDEAAAADPILRKPGGDEELLDTVGAGACAKSELRPLRTREKGEILSADSQEERC